MSEDIIIKIAEINRIYGMYDIYWAEFRNNPALNTDAPITYAGVRITNAATNKLAVARPYVYILNSSPVCINCFATMYITLNIKYMTGISINA